MIAATSFTARLVGIPKKWENGERGGTRTHDHMIKSHVLYQLSYALEPT